MHPWRSRCLCLPLPPPTTPTPHTHSLPSLSPPPPRPVFFLSLAATILALEGWFWQMKVKGLRPCQ